LRILGNIVHDQIQPTIAIDVRKKRPREASLLAIESRRGGHILEGAIPPIAKQAVATLGAAHQIDVVPSIGVIVPHRNAAGKGLRPVNAVRTRRAMDGMQTRGCGMVGERPRRMGTRDPDENHRDEQQRTWRMAPSHVPNLFKKVRLGSLHQQTNFTTLPAS